MDSHSALDSLLLDAIENELRSLGDVLHDTVCQSLAGASMRVARLLRAAETGRPLSPEDLRQLSRMIESAIDQARSLSRRFHPTDLSGAGLMTALSELAGECPAACGFEFRCEVPVFVDNAQLALTLYRIAEQSCRTALDLHAKHICVTLERRAETVRLEVRHDGNPLPPESLSEKLLRSRAQFISATIEIIPEENRWTRIVCVVSAGSAASNP